MRQRLGIATALLGDPPLLMLDEPFNGMDPEGIIWMRGFLHPLARRGRAVLVSSHLMSELQDAASWVVIIRRGRVLADATVAGLQRTSSSLEEAYLKLTRDAVEYRAANGTGTGR